jgi:hypothetical protein
MGHSARTIKTKGATDMTTILQPAPTIAADDPIHEAVAAHIVPGFAEAFPSAIPETVGVLADLRDRFESGDRGCTAGIGRD